ncbi:MAG: hypothetical protein ACREDK_04700 [Thermoplasmata archaeon]
MSANPLSEWKEQFTFRASAEREFLALPEGIQRAFLRKFPLLARHPWRTTAELDVAPLRDMPGRWRLKVEGGHRATYRDLQGRPDFEMFESRDEIYERLQRYIGSRP